MKYELFSNCNFCKGFDYEVDYNGYGGCSVDDWEPF